ncbi:MAG TPA: LamG-like jellyroll fold domain-containing protein [Solirubrobacteraceae bacterium]|nr:LamG-like jellyroll fold domain-containing protein [Solirubrobacteraceae bacterium]
MKTLIAVVLGVAVSLMLAPAAVADSAGLVAAYGFEETAGTAAIDSSGSGNPGVFNGATRSASGRFGAAASFDGVNDRIDIADSDALDLSVGMTLEAWVRPTALGWRTAIMKERPGGIAYALYASTDTNRPSTEIQAETRAPAAMATNVWTHVASTYDGATLRLYVNGGQVAGRAVSGPITITSGALRIGGNTVWGEYFKGLIDEVRVYNRALTAGELQIDMNTAIVSTSADTQAPTAPVLTASLTGGDDVQLSWTAATDDLGVEQYRVYRNAGLYTSLPASARSTTVLNVPPGTSTFKVTAVDAAGHATDSNTESVTIEPDTEAPTEPELTTSVSGADVHLTWTASSDERGLAEYEVWRSWDGSWQRIALVSTAILDYYDLGLPDRTYRYFVVAVDKAGNRTSSDVVAAEVGPADLEPPTAPVLSAVNEGGSWYLRWTPSTDDRGIREYSVWRNGSLFQFLPGASITELWLVSGAAGTWKVRATDTAGKASEFSNEVTINVPDVSKPQLIVDPGCGAGTRSEIVRIGGSVSDNSGGDVTVRAEIDGTTIWGPSAFKGPYSFNWDTRAVANGPHTLSFSARDAAGNEAVISCSVTVSNSVLSIPITGAQDGGTVSGTVAFGFQPRADGVAATTPAFLEIDGERVIDTAAAPYEYSWDSTDVPDGVHTIRAGMYWGSYPSPMATTTIEVRVDNTDVTAPTVTLDAGCDGRTLSEYVGPINGTATDDGGGDVTVRVLVDGDAIWGPNTFKGAFHFDWDTRTVSNGPHTMTVIARDAAGNETVEDCPWTVSNSALSVPITGAADGGTVSGTVTLGFQPKADGSAATTPAFLQIDGATVADTPAGPYSYGWDTTGVANGVHTIKASMYWRDYPNVMATATIQVTVNNAPPPAPSGLVASYGFEQTSGTTVTDSSGKGSTGTLSGATWAPDGRFGRALSFDGVNDIVTVPDSNLLDLGPGMTLEAWVKPTTTNDWRTVLLKERPGQLAYSLYASGDSARPLAEIAAGSQRDARGTASLPVGVWTHLAATYDRSTLRLYVNGTQVSSTAVTGTLLNSSGALRIGGNTVWGEYFSGLIDEVRVYERALGAAEIAADKDRAV